MTEYLDAAVARADGMLEEGRRQEALAALGKLADDNPARKEPWVRLARMHFDAGSYGQAIVATDEVLQRDPDDRTAASIRAVSGLRVATKSLNDLRNDEALAGTARADAESLAKVLRETLGQDVLVPPAVKPEPARSSARNARSSSRTPPAPRSQSPVGASPRNGSVSGNPFGALQ